MEPLSSIIISHKIIIPKRKKKIKKKIAGVFIQRLLLCDTAKRNVSPIGGSARTALISCRFSELDCKLNNSSISCLSIKSMRLVCPSRPTYAGLLSWPMGVGLSHLEPRACTRRKTVTLRGSLTQSWPKLLFSCGFSDLHPRVHDTLSHTVV